MTFSDPSMLPNANEHCESSSPAQGQMMGTHMIPGASRDLASLACRQKTKELKNR